MNKSEEMLDIVEDNTNISESLIEGVLSSIIGSIKDMSVNVGKNIIGNYKSRRLTDALLTIKREMNTALNKQEKQFKWLEPELKNDRELSLILKSLRDSLVKLSVAVDKRVKK